MMKYTVNNFNIDEDINLSHDELKQLRMEVYSSFTRYGESFCYDRSKQILNDMGIGKVITFSISGNAICDMKANETRLTIPHRRNYPYGINWIYHTVYVYKNYVITHELEYPMKLDTYIKILNALNNSILKHKGLKSVHMKIEFERMEQRI